MENVEGQQGAARKRKPGRPQKTVKRSNLIVVRMTPIELMAIRSRAAQAGMKPSEWFRQAARSARVAPRLSVEEMGWLRSLSGLANNLNQLTKLAHTQGLFSLATTLREALTGVDELRDKLMGHDR